MSYISDIIFHVNLSKCCLKIFTQTHTKELVFCFVLFLCYLTVELFHLLKCRKGIFFPLPLSNGKCLSTNEGVFLLLENSFRCTRPPTPIQRIHKLISFAADIIYPSRGKVLHNPLQEVLAADFRNAALLWSWTERDIGSGSLMLVRREQRVLPSTINK